MKSSRIRKSAPFLIVAVIPMPGWAGSAKADLAVLDSISPILLTPCLVAALPLVLVVAAARAPGRILGLSAVAKDAGEIAAAGVYILEAGMTTAQVAAAWSPYLTMAEGIRIAVKAFTTDVSELSCCA